MQLMLRCWAVLGGLCETRAADAHDAGLFWVSCVKPHAADAHDAGLIWVSCVKPHAADAHDAGLFGVQLMLMMLGCFGCLA